MLDKSVNILGQVTEYIDNEVM